ncbi:MAG TPA: glycoside hydrolase family 2 TIM barrel-domain containing protein [Thermoleophilaceae bacterium]|nr:glycoside hydrolase family 2 TIM barrel-domain containing protein [Thermoleophilaceae bacterium]
MRRALALAAAFVALPCCAAAAALPRGQTLDRGWEVRTQSAAPAPPQPPPPVEGQPEGSPEPPGAASLPSGRTAQAPLGWSAVRIPSVFNTTAVASEYPGSVRRYRVRFTGPATPRGFRWLVHFDSVRRSATVFLNGRRLGKNTDPYTPFSFEARGLRPRRTNELMVIVDSRKDPRLPEGWWNWGGIVRPVSLVPAGRAYLRDLGTMSRVKCRGPATGCRAELLVDGVLEKRGVDRLRPTLEVRLRSPSGRRIRRVFALPRQRSERRRVRLALKVPAPQLWRPEDPKLYSAQLVLRDRGSLQQVERRRVGMRSVEVKHGRLLLNNREIRLTGASIHEDMPGSGAALTPADMDRIVADLKEVGANVTRAHYLLNDRLLARLDRAGIMVWSQAPIWQRDRRNNILREGLQRRRAWETVRRTVIAARSHPSVITHSVANELWSRPDDRPGVTRRFLETAARDARDLDPTLPISVDINGRPYHPEQFTYHAFDMLGINQYFGWYSWVSDFNLLPFFLQEMRDLYPRHALVMTEFGAEARPELATAPVGVKGSYAFQSFHLDRTLDVADAAPISGAIYWTLREFEIFPGWTGGAGRRPPPYQPNTRHQKGLLTYEGEKKPAWFRARDRFMATPLYP